VFRQKNLRTVPNLLIVSLALGDFLFILFCVPFGAIAYSLEYYPFSTFYCRFEHFIINLSLGVSVFSLLALSADRYKIIVKPFSSHANDPSIKLKTVVISIWLLSIFLALPETIYSGELLAIERNEIVNRTNVLERLLSNS
jgi:bombesin-like receptor 3